MPKTGRYQPQAANYFDGGRKAFKAERKPMYFEQRQSNPSDPDDSEAEQAGDQGQKELDLILDDLNSLNDQLSQVLVHERVNRLAAVRETMAGLRE